MQGKGGCCHLRPHSAGGEILEILAFGPERGVQTHPNPKIPKGFLLVPDERGDRGHRRGQWANPAVCKGEGEGSGGPLAAGRSAGQVEDTDEVAAEVAEERPLGSPQAPLQRGTGRAPVRCWVPSGVRGGGASLVADWLIVMEVEDPEGSTRQELPCPQSPLRLGCGRGQVPFYNLKHNLSSCVQ